MLIVRVQFHFLKDLMKEKEIELEYCGT